MSDEPAGRLELPDDPAEMKVGDEVRVTWKGEERTARVVRVDPEARELDVQLM